MAATFMFYLFSLLTLGAAVGVIVSRNTVHSAMYMILSFIGMAGLFGWLSAFFLALLQVLVYAGAVMVLFLFIIMLISTKEASTSLTKPKIIMGGATALLLIIAIAMLFGNQEIVTTAGIVEATEPPQTTMPVKAFGYHLFTRYLVPFQVSGFLLLATMVGVILISKRSKGEI